MKRTIWGLIFGLGIALFLTALAGEKPLFVLQVLFKSSFGTADDMGLTLFYATSLIFTGLSVAIAYEAGLFNIGAEGQLTIATIAAAWVGVSFPNVSPFIAPMFALLGGLLAAAIWGFIPGFLRAYRGSHEVIVTMMLNFVAAGLASYVTLELIRSSESQNPETSSVAAQYLFKNVDFVSSFAPNSPLNLTFVFAIVLCLVIWLLKKRSYFFYKSKMVGLNPEACDTYGIDSKKVRMWAMTFAGMAAGLVCMNEVMGSAGKFRMGFSPDYGFIGIAVALLARNNPIGIIFSAFFFAVLQKGASDLDFETEHITRDFSRILQAVLILSLIVAHKINFKRKSL